MHVVVYGATGGLGQPVVREALSAGHSVTAFLRSPDELEVSDDRLRCVVGDFGNPEEVRRVLDGADAVLSAIGHSKGQDPELYGRGMQAIVDGMRARDIDRLVAISGAGLELPGDEGGLGRRLIIAALKLFAGKVLAGKQAEWDVIREAEVDWTLVRVARMVDRPPSGQVAVHASKVSGSPMVAYGDVARFMVEQLTDDTWVRAAPFVSGA